LPPATAPPAILIQKSPPAGGTSTSLASSSATATPIYTATPVAKVQAAPPPLVEETPPPQAPRPPTPTAEELRQAELETDKAIQAGYEDAQRRAMAQRDAEMARARARYATTQQQGNVEYQIYSANMDKVTAPKAPLPANRKLPEYVIDPTRGPGLPNRDHNAPIT
ncbi:unnamed protein product, partial [Symbiodinium pilosum]